MIDETAARARLDALAKPRGSLGRLEDAAARLAAIMGTNRPRIGPGEAALLVFAADHGVVAEGIGIWPQAVTRTIAAAVATGRSAAAAMAAAAGVPVTVVDVGMAGPKVPGAVDRRVAEGTANFAHGPAMDKGRSVAAFSAGYDAAAELIRGGARLLALGEVGIGNTTSAACLAALLADVPLDQAVGPGAGSTPETLAAKRRVVADAVRRGRESVRPSQWMAHFGGFELAALGGAMVACRDCQVPAVLDGYATGVAALHGRACFDGLADGLIAAHCSAEPGHAAVLRSLGLQPLLTDWNMRLGEGSGAVLAVGLLRQAAALLSETALLADLLPAP